MEDMTLRELCDAYGISRRAVQGFEKLKLVQPTGRNPRGYLLYDWKAQEMIQTIKQYQDFGFSLKEIRTLQTCPREELRKYLISQRKVLEAKQEHLSTEIEILSDMIQNLC